MFKEFNAPKMTLILICRGHHSFGSIQVTFQGKPRHLVNCYHFNLPATSGLSSQSWHSFPRQCFCALWLNVSPQSWIMEGNFQRFATLEGLSWIAPSQRSSTAVRRAWIEHFPKCILFVEHHSQYFLEMTKCFFFYHGPLFEHFLSFPSLNFFFFFFL